MKKLFTTLLGFLFIAITYSQSNAIHKNAKIDNQVIIGVSGDNSAALTIDVDDKGFLMKPITTAQRDAILNPPRGLIIHNGTTNQYERNTGTPSVPVWTSLGGGTEIDPIFSASPSVSITGAQITNWDNAYSWGDHGAAGYDPSATNELNTTITLETGNVLSLTDAGGAITVDLSSLAGGADGNGIFDVANNNSSVASSFNVTLTDYINFDGVKIDPLGSTKIRLGGSGIIDNGIWLGVSTPSPLNYHIAGNGTDLDLQSQNGKINFQNFNVSQQLIGSFQPLALNTANLTLQGGLSNKKIDLGDQRVIGALSGFKHFIGADATNGKVILGAYNGTSVTEQVELVTSTGNFGIGVSPSSKLHVGGNTQVDGDLDNNGDANFDLATDGGFIVQGASTIHNREIAKFQSATGVTSLDIRYQTIGINTTATSGINLSLRASASNHDPLIMYASDNSIMMRYFGEKDLHLNSPHGANGTEVGIGKAKQTNIALSVQARATNGADAFNVYDAAGVLKFGIQTETGTQVLDRYYFPLPSYADDSAAGIGGLTTGEAYQTDGTGASPLNVAGIVMIKQ